MSTLSKRTTRVTNAVAGAGSFLDPPTYPTHAWGIETDTNRKPENRGSTSLTSHNEEWIDEETAREAKALLDAWQPPPLDNAEIHEWVLQVLGYFRNCYRGADDGEYGRGPWAAESLTIDAERDPVEHADEHAGVHLIREFYPDFAPTADDFAAAYWGTKPEGGTE